MPACWVGIVWCIGRVSRFGVVLDIEKALNLEFDEQTVDAASVMTEQRFELLESLVSIRELRGVSRVDVAKLMGLEGENEVARFECGDRTFTLTELISYALAVGAVVTMRAEPYEEYVSGSAD